MNRIGAALLAAVRWPARAARRHYAHIQHQVYLEIEAGVAEELARRRDRHGPSA